MEVTMPFKALFDDDDSRTDAIVSEEQASEVFPGWNCDDDSNGCPNARHISCIKFWDGPTEAALVYYVGTMAPDNMAATAIYRAVLERVKKHEPDDKHLAFNRGATRAFLDRISDHALIVSGPDLRKWMLHNHGYQTLGAVADHAELEMYRLGLLP